MTIQTKYTIGDKVNYRSLDPDSSKIETSIITWIGIGVSANKEPLILYTTDNAEDVEESRIL